MAWLLVRAFSDSKPTAWQLGDIVEVRDDAFTGWGTLETLPRFYRVQISGVQVSTVKRLLERMNFATTTAIDGAQIDRLDNIRDYRLTLADLPPALRSTLETTGTVTLTKQQARAAIKDRRGNNVVL